MIPARVRGLRAAMDRHGAVAERLARLYNVGDPVVDDIVEQFPDAIRRLRGWMRDPGEAPVDVRALLLASEAFTHTFSPDRLSRGARVMRSLGVLGPVVLVTYCLPQAYAAPVGNKPLIATGDLVHQAPRRLQHTSDWWQSVVRSSHVTPGSEGYATTLHVRFAHATVRSRLRRSASWSVRERGVPIPQPDLAATGLLFGPVMLDGLRRLGAQIETDDADCVNELFCAVSGLLGVPDELRTTTHRQGLRRFDLLTGWQAAPDDDSRSLVHALFDVPRHTLGRVRGGVASRALHALAHELLPNDLAEGLAVRKGLGTTAALRLLRPCIGQLLGRPDGRRAAAQRRLLTHTIRVQAGGEGIWPACCKVAHGISMVNAPHKVS